MTITPEELAYIAGFIDGEGCLHIGKCRRTHPHKTTEYHAKILITNTCPDVLVWIQSLFGGYLHKTVDRGTGRRDCYNLHLSRAAAEELIDQVYPYLRMKAGQANCLRLFWALRKKFAYPKHPGVNGSRPSSKEYLDLQEACYRQNKALNKRGVDAEAANERS